MLQLENLSRRFGEKHVIEALSFCFPDQGAFALMGPSGCGKTTLLRLVAGLDRPDGGQIVSTHARPAVAFQEARLLPWYDVQKNLAVTLPQDRLEEAKKWLSLLELDGVKRAMPHELSGGMRQRVSLARAMAMQSDLYLLDEPFAALDLALRERIAPHIRLATQNALLIAVTHDPHDAALLGAVPLQVSGAPITALTEKTP